MGSPTTSFLASGQSNKWEGVWSFHSQHPLVVSTLKVLNGIPGIVFLRLSSYLPTILPFFNIYLFERQSYKEKSPRGEQVFHLPVHSPDEQNGWAKPKREAEARPGLTLSAGAGALTPPPPSPGSLARCAIGSRTASIELVLHWRDFHRGFIAWTWSVINSISRPSSLLWGWWVKWKVPSWHPGTCQDSTHYKKRYSYYLGSFKGLRILWGQYPHGPIHTRGRPWYNIQGYWF